MAIWSSSFYGSGGASTPVFEIIAAEGSRLHIIEVCLSFDSAMLLSRIMRGSAPGLPSDAPGTRIPFVQEDEYSPAIDTPGWLVWAWKRETPISGALGGVSLRRVRAGAGTGCVWTFPRGLVVTPTSTVSVDGTTSNAVDVSVTVEV